MGIAKLMFFLEAKHHMNQFPFLRIHEKQHL